MIKLNNKELLEVQGGAVKIGLLFGIAAGISFLIGVIDGIIRPLKCN